MKIVFMGTPPFAVPSLENLLLSPEHTVLAVFTQPEKPQGRKNILTPPAVKVCAQKNSVPVFQPHSLKDETIFSLLKELDPDIIVVVAYGHILPRQILNIPLLGCINVHASLLPKYRGAAPIAWAIINGEAQTGVTTMFMDEGLDSGDMLLQQAIKIGENETEGELRQRLSLLGADLLIKTLEGLKNRTIERKKQNGAKVSLAPMFKKQQAVIDWRKSAAEIHNWVRGLNPWPCAVTSLYGKDLKIYKTALPKNIIGATKDCGIIINLNPLMVECDDHSVIELKEVQCEGKRRMSASDFINGRISSTNPIRVGDIFF